MVEVFDEVLGERESATNNAGCNGQSRLAQAPGETAFENSEDGAGAARHVRTEPVMLARLEG